MTVFTELEQRTAVEPLAASTRHGFMLVIPDNRQISRSLLMYGEWAQAELDLLCRCISMECTVIEIGANVGAHTLAFSRKVGPRGTVWAFEAEPVVFDLLQKNVAINACINVRLDCVAAGNGGSSAVSLFAAPLEGIDRLSMVALDNLALSACDLVKVDAHGLEQDFLGGMIETVRRLRPILYFTCHDQAAAISVCAGVEDLGYRSFLVRTSVYNPANYRGEARDFFGNVCKCGIILVPEERSCPIAPDTHIDVVPIPTSKEFAKYLPSQLHSDEAVSINLMLERLEGELLAARSTRACDRRDLKLASQQLRNLEQDNARLEFRGASLFAQLMNSERRAEELHKAHQALDARARESDAAKTLLESRCASLLDQLTNSERRAEELHKAYQALDARARESDAAKTLLESRCASLLDQLTNSERCAEELHKEAYEALDAQDNLIAKLEADRTRRGGQLSVRLAGFARLYLYRLSRPGLFHPSYARLAASGLFDKDFYLEQNPDVAKTGHNPLLHFLLHGAGEGRDPSPLFHTSWYLAAYPDVVAAKINPLLHYFLHGAAEGRRPRRSPAPGLSNLRRTESKP